ncbi:hypothetical protein [Pseudomonas sp. NPDC008258]|uniref:hypothetical protein n=1 Tax=Pseudomonas sp. NPDC008258 TaxID=3364418 RepID=UPI0036E1F2F5
MKLSLEFQVELVQEVSFAREPDKDGALRHTAALAIFAVEALLKQGVATSAPTAVAPLNSAP